MAFFHGLFKKKAEELPQSDPDTISYTGLEAPAPQMDVAPGPPEMDASEKASAGFDFPGEYSQRFDGVDPLPPQGTGEFVIPSLGDAETGIFTELQGISTQVDTVDYAESSGDWEHLHEFRSGKSAQPDYNFESPSSPPGDASGGEDQVTSVEHSASLNPADAAPDHQAEHPDFAWLPNSNPTPDDAAGPFKGEIAGIEPGYRPGGQSADKYPENMKHEVREHVQFSGQSGPDDLSEAAAGGAGAMNIEPLQDTIVVKPVDSETPDDGSTAGSAFNGKFLSARDLTSDQSHQGDGSAAASLRSDGELVQVVNDGPETADGGFEDVSAPDVEAGAQEAGVYGYGGAKGEYGPTPAAAEEPVNLPGSLEFPNLTFHMPEADPVVPDEVTVRGWDPDEKKAIIGEPEDQDALGLSAPDGSHAQEGITKVEAMTWQMNVPDDDDPNALVDLTNESPGLTPIHDNQSFAAAPPDNGDADSDGADDDL